MKENTGTIRYVIWGIKLVLALFFVWTAGSSLFLRGLEPYYTCEEYWYQNDFSDGVSMSDVSQVCQDFIARGNMLPNIMVYIGQSSGEQLTIAVEEQGGTVISSAVVDTADGYESEQWAMIPVNSTGLERGKVYRLRISSPQGLSALRSVQGNRNPDIFGQCTVSEEVQDISLGVGFQFIYRYLGTGNFMEFLFCSLWSVFLAGLLCYTVFRFEFFYGWYRASETKLGIPHALFLAVSFALIYNPLDTARNEVAEFGRQIGNGIVENIDVSRRIDNFSVWFLIFALAFVLFFLLANYSLRLEETGERKKAVKFINQFMALANADMVLTCFTFLSGRKNGIVFPYSSCLIVVILLFAAVYLILNLDRHIAAEDYLKLMVTASSLAWVPVVMITRQLWTAGRLLLGVQIILMTGALFVVKGQKELFKDRRVSYALGVSAVVCSLIPFGASFFREAVNILNQYEIFFTHLSVLYGFLTFLGLAAAVPLGIFAWKRQRRFWSWKTAAYPFLIFGIMCISLQIPLQGMYDTDIVESANYSILISDFLNFGSIPLVEHYGGHMMLDVWEGLLYGLLNHDYAGAVFSPYASYCRTVSVLLFYYLVKEVWDEDMALFTALFFPFFDFWTYYGLGMLVCLAVAAYMKKNTYRRAAVIWSACVWCALYRLDLGFAFGFGAISALAVYVVIYKNCQAVRQLLATLAGWAIVGAGAWFGICLVKGISPVKRLAEFLVISLSNGNWAYGSVGDPGNMIFGWLYVFVPFAAVLCLIYIVFSKNMKRQDRIGIWAILMVMGFSYFSNFSRGLVRHSLHEMNVPIVLWSGYVFLSAAVSCAWEKPEWFPGVLLGLILCSTALESGKNYTPLPVIDSAVSKTGEFTRTWTLRPSGEDGKQKAVRVLWDEELKHEVEPYRFIMDTLLEEDETFVDFINKSFLYSVINRRDPAYISQSPMQLSGQFAQELFVGEISGTPLVLMPASGPDDWQSTSMDLIANPYRYYKTAEYIYQNYIPLCRYGYKFAVWCLPERYDEMVEKLQQGKDTAELSGQGEFDASECELIDYGYDGPIKSEDGTYSYTNVLHNYELQHLPAIWAQLDEKDAASNPVVLRLSQEDKMFTFDRGSLTPGTNGNYLLISAGYSGQDHGNSWKDDDEMVRGTVRAGTYADGTFEEKCRFGMIFREGTHDYLIRVSADYYWYLGEINAFCVQSEEPLHKIEMSILEGD